MLWNEKSISFKNKREILKAILSNFFSPIRQKKYLSASSIVPSHAKVIKNINY